MSSELEYYGFRDLVNLQDKLAALEVLENAIKSNRYDRTSLQKYFGLAESHIEFIFSLFPELKTNQKPPHNKLLETYRQYKAEYRRIQAKMLQGMELWIFPKFRSLVGAVCKGMFEGRPISDIIDSLVVILVPSIENNILLLHMFSGEKCVGIFGLGSYIVKFTPEVAKEPTIFLLPIDAIIMDLNFYELALNSPKKLSIPKYSDFVREHVIRIPLAQVAESDFVLRLFAPVMRDISEYLLSYLKVIGSLPKGQTLDDVQILSAWRGAMNKILVTREKFDRILEEVKKGIPGLMGYEGILDKLDELPLVKAEFAHISSKWIAWARFVVAGYDLIESLAKLR
ncbi:MAG: hypothetical protein QXJ52_01960 [Candidatus Korarchaeota archaeon]|nr:hypothetical protein [Thermoproteota archaeon]